MAGVNTVILVGNLGRTPEVKHTQASVPVATFSLATSESWKDKATGDWQEKTQWHKIVCWDKIAEQAGKLLKGSQVYVSGTLEYRKYTGKDGVEKEVAEIRAQRILGLGKKEAAPATAVDDDDNLPF